MTTAPRGLPVRPGLLVVCVGTATEVGKTWVGAALLAELGRRGVAVAARKPAQSFDPTVDEPTDAHVLADAAGDSPGRIVPEHRSYPIALAPPMAAARLHRSAPRLSELLDELSWPAGCRVGWLETVGGVRSPIAENADSLAITAAVKPDLIVLVGDAALGAIGSLASALDSLSLAPDSLENRTVVMLNRFDRDDPTHVENLNWLRRHHPQPVLTDVSILADRLLDARSLA